MERNLSLYVKEKNSSLVRQGWLAALQGYRGASHRAHLEEENEEKEANGRTAGGPQCRNDP